MRIQNEILTNLNKSDLLERSIWKRITGPKVRYMDEKYQDQIVRKLIPILNAYDIDISDRAYNKGPGKQTYVGFDSEGNRILFVFTNNNVNMEDDEKKKWTLFLRIFYLDKVEDVGMLDLDNTDNINKAFALITQTLEDMGFKLKEETKEEDKEEVEDPDIATLRDFKNSLSESELQEINN